MQSPRLNVSELNANGGPFGVDRRCLRISLVQEIVGTLHFLDRSVGNQKEFAALHLGLVFHDAILRNADTGQCGAKSADPAHNGGAFEGTDDPHGEGPRHEQGTDAWHPEKAEPNSSPQNPPQKAPCLSQYSMRSPAL